MCVCVCAAAFVYFPHDMRDRFSIDFIQNDLELLPLVNMQPKDSYFFGLVKEQMNSNFNIYTISVENIN